MNDLRSLLAHIGALGLIVGTLFVVVRFSDTGELGVINGTPTSNESIETATTTESSPSVATSTAATSSATKKAEKTSVTATNSPSATSSNQVARIQNPYTTPPLSFEAVNISARQALVNIACSPQSGAGLKPISGSGILIDPRGVILTNAHVAQYVLLAQSGRTDLSCRIRTGSPATANWIPIVMYIPPVWVEQHAKDILKSNPIGTGEHDYALLYAFRSIDDTPLPTFPYLHIDTRAAIGFPDDSVLTASYPVEFLGGLAAQNALYPVTSITTIKKLMTLAVSSPDVLSLGGVIQAQGGSSGGAVVNQWGRLIGVVTTTSQGQTTADRDLHAIALSYIDRDLKALTNYTIAEVLEGDPENLSAEFAAKQVGRLADILVRALGGN